MYQTDALERAASASPPPAGVTTTAYRVESVSALRFPRGELPLTLTDRQFLDTALPPQGAVPLGHDGVSGMPYRLMFTALLAQQPPPGPVDLTVAACAVPDYALADIPAIDAAAATQGGTTMFGVTDHGRLAAFAGLRLGAVLAARQGAERFVLLVADQATLPYAAVTDALSGAEGNLAALVVLRRAGDDNGTASAAGTDSQRALPALRVARRPMRSADTYAAADEVFHALVGAGPLPAAVVVGDGCRCWSPPAPVARLAAPQGQPVAGLWERLAGHRAGPELAPGPVVVIDADPGVAEVAAAWL